MMNVAVAFSLLMTFLPIAVAQQTRPVDPEKERLEEIANLKKQAASMPQVKATSVEQLVRFSVEEEMLTVRTALAVREAQQVWVKAPGLNDFLFLSTFVPQDPNNKTNSENEGRNFQLVYNDLSDASAGQVITHVQATGGRLIVARDAENSQAVWSIQLIQDPPLAPGQQPDQDPVRLLVQRNDQNGNDANHLDVKVSGKTFSELRRKHAAEVNQYLRPIIRDFKQEAAVFGVPAPVAWQVLGGNDQPDPKLAAQVKAILAKLDADDFRVRENALEELKKLGQPAATMLARMDRSKLSLQQSSGIESFLSESAPLAPNESAHLGDDKDFLLDVLYNDDPSLVKLALDRLSKATSRTIRVNLKSDPAARAEAIARLRDELVPSPLPRAPAATQPTSRPVETDRQRWQF